MCFKNGTVMNHRTFFGGIFSGSFGSIQMDVSKNRGTPKWMVKIMENPIKMDDLRVPLFLETPEC